MSRRTVFVSVLFALCCTSLASAEAISLNFGSDGYAVGSNAAGVVNVGNWNDIPIAQQTGLALKDSSGALSGLTLSTAKTYSWSPSAYWPNGAAFTLPGDTQMMQANIYQDTSVGSTLDLTFTGTVPYNTFDIYVYYNANVPGNTQTLSILDSAGVVRPGIATQTGYEDGSPDTEFILSTGSNASNYVKFTGLTSAGVGNDFVVRAEGTGGFTIATFSGLQIIGVPEPSTLALLATGVCGLLCYAWRKNK